MKFTVPFLHGKRSPFCEARDALILYFYDEADVCLFLLDSLDREHQNMQTVRTLWPTTGPRLGPTLDSLQCDRATCSRTQVPFTIYVLGK